MRVFGFYSASTYKVELGSTGWLYRDLQTAQVWGSMVGQQGWVGYGMAGKIGAVAVRGVKGGEGKH